ncbi:hypothetical protein JHK87_044405 [Glycine soja]|nr:hypothetical protein JHK87_044405 [Glycine soja]
MIPVAANDVAFSIHAVLLTAITLFQIAIYERGSQKVSKVSIGIVSVAWLVAAVCFFIALPNDSWLCIGFSPSSSMWLSLLLWLIVFVSCCLVFNLIP